MLAQPARAARALRAPALLLPHAASPRPRPLPRPQLHPPERSPQRPPPPRRPAQTAPGKYDEGGLEALDYVLDSARRHGIQLILSFVDNWKYYNGVAQFVDWCGSVRTGVRPVDAGGDTDDTKWTPDQKRYESTRHAEFFSSERCHDMFQDHMKVMLNRKVRGPAPPSSHQWVPRRAQSLRCEARA